MKDALWGARLVVGLVLIVASPITNVFFHHLSSLVILAVLIYPVRAVRWGTVYDFFLLGIFWSFAIVGLQWVLEVALLGQRAELFRSAVVAPLTEEPLKILPLAIAILLSRTRFRACYGACDLMLLGAALGAGFGMVEDGLRHATYPATRATPALFGLPLFPDSYNHFAGHAGTTAIVGLALGLLLYAVRWRRLVVPGLFVVAAALVWVMVDHGLANYNVNATVPAFVRWIWAADGEGERTATYLLALILATMAVERLLLWRALRRVPRLGWRRSIRSVAAPLRRGRSYPELRRSAMRAKTLALYLLGLRQLGYLIVRLAGDLPGSRPAPQALPRRCLDLLAVRRAVFTS